MASALDRIHARTLALVAGELALEELPAPAHRARGVALDQVHRRAGRELVAVTGSDLVLEGFPDLASRHVRRDLGGVDELRLAGTGEGEKDRDGGAERAAEV
jgi:hypothetical protein